MPTHLIIQLVLSWDCANPCFAPNIQHHYVHMPSEKKLVVHYRDRVVLYLQNRVNLVGWQSIANLLSSNQTLLVLLLRRRLHDNVYDENAINSFLRSSVLARLHCSKNARLTRGACVTIIEST